MLYAYDNSLTNYMYIQVYLGVVHDICDKGEG